MIDLRFLPSEPLPSGELRRAACSAIGDVAAFRDRFEVMKRQYWSKYSCRDYILRRDLERLNADTGVDDDTVDIVCREHMCEWANRIVDHFHGSREIVAISLSYLDRFLDRCCCDRAVFKLASITSLYIATKLNSRKHISMKSLAALSRGEFGVENIAEMECIILETLEWHLHPPTVKAFVEQLIRLLPLDIDDRIRERIYHRAHFFAELSVLNYGLSIGDPANIALSAILNAIDGFEYPHITNSAVTEFLEFVEQTTKVNAWQSRSISTVRYQLWELYNKSEEFHRQIPSAPGIVTDLLSGTNGICDSCDELIPLVISSNPKERTAEGRNSSPISVRSFG